MAEVVRRQGQLTAHDGSNLGHVLLQEVQPLFREVDAAQGVWHVVEVIPSVAGQARLLGRQVGGPAGGRCGPSQLLQIAQGRAQGARLVGDQVGAHIHLGPGKASSDAFLESLTHGARRVIALGVGVAIQPHAVAELAAQHLIDGHAVGLAGQIPQGHLDAADAASLPTVPAELLDAAEQAVHVARILSQDAALEHLGIQLVGAVAHLAIAHQALVGLDLEQDAMHRRADDIGKAHVGDA